MPVIECQHFVICPIDNIMVNTDECENCEYCVELRVADVDCSYEDEEVSELG